MVSRSLGLVDSRSELIVLVTNRTGNERRSCGRFEVTIFFLFLVVKLAVERDVARV